MSVNVLIIKNISTEGPGTIGDHLLDNGIPSTTIDLSIGQRLPETHEYTHLLVMGGPMAVYEMDRFSYLADEARFLEQAIRQQKHILGVCLGSQLLAHVLGARVYPGGQKEIGWYEVSMTDEATTDPFMSGLALPGKNAAQVFQWHGDTFDLPAGATRLASSELYPNQAFRHGRGVYGLQFHVEVTPAIVHGWLEGEKGIDLASLDAESNRLYIPYRERASASYSRFFSMR